MPRNRLRVCTAMTAPPLLPAKTGIRIPQVVLSYLQTHERRHMRYPLLDVIPLTFDIRHSNVGHQAILMLTFIPFKCPTSNNLRLRSF